MCTCMDHVTDQNLAQELVRLQRSYDWIADSFAFTGHELRNGLLRLRLITEQLEREAGLNDQQMQRVLRVSKAARNLEFTALNCLKLAEIDHGGFSPTFTSVDPLSEIIEPLLEDYAEMLAVHQQTCHIEILSEDVQLYADGELIKLVVNNLMNNAVKYGIRHGEIIIQVGLAADDTILISVWNSGQGIAPQICERIFDRFETGGTSGEIPSTGIGLYLVKRIIEAHQGTVYCQSQPEEWARFSLELPRWFTPSIQN